MGEIKPEMRAAGAQSSTGTQQTMTRGTVPLLVLGVYLLGASGAAPPDPEPARASPSRRRVLLSPPLRARLEPVMGDLLIDDGDDLLDLGKRAFDDYGHMRRIDIRLRRSMLATIKVAKQYSYKAGRTLMRLETGFLGGSDISIRSFISPEELEVILQLTNFKFGKRGDPEDKFDDYGHMRFGRGHV